MFAMVVMAETVMVAWVVSKHGGSDNNHGEWMGMILGVHWNSGNDGARDGGSGSVGVIRDWLIQFGHNFSKIFYSTLECSVTLRRSKKADYIIF